jgi:hypothetical protein
MVRPRPARSLQVIRQLPSEVSAPCRYNCEAPNESICYFDPIIAVEKFKLRRLECISLVSGFAVGWPLAAGVVVGLLLSSIPAEAQAQKIPRVGFLCWVTCGDEYHEVFWQALRRSAGQLERARPALPSLREPAMPRQLVHPSWRKPHSRAYASSAPGCYLMSSAISARASSMQSS